MDLRDYDSMEEDIPDISYDPMYTSYDKKEEDSEVLQAAAILLKLSKDPRLTPSALDRFSAAGTHIEVLRAVDHESLSQRKRKLGALTKTTTSGDIAVYKEGHRPMATPISRRRRPKMASGPSESESACVQGMNIKIDIEAFCCTNNFFSISRTILQRNLLARSPRRLPKPP